jgi:quinol monooxygenase YgiN
MAKIVEMDERITISAQWEENVGPVILINKFGVNPEDLDLFLKAWADEARNFKKQPGFISTQLHRRIGGSSVFANYAVWEFATHFKKAVNNVMNAKDRMSAYPPALWHPPIYSRRLEYLRSV